MMSCKANPPLLVFFFCNFCLQLIFPSRGSFQAELIFVTNIKNYICGEKIVMWRNFGKFWELLWDFATINALSSLLDPRYEKDGRGAQDSAGRRTVKTWESPNFGSFVFSASFWMKHFNSIYLKPFFSEVAEIGSCDSYSSNDPSIFQTFKTA